MVTLHAGNAGEQSRDATTDHPCADDGDAVADERGRVPHSVHRGLDSAGEHRAVSGNVVGDEHNRVFGDDVGTLVRIQAEHRSSTQLAWPLGHDADVQVAVLHRPGESAVLERRAHRVVLVGRDVAAEDE